MIPNETLLTIAKQLKDRTIAGSVRWNTIRGSNIYEHVQGRVLSENPFAPNRFELRFPSSIARIGRFSPKAKSDYIQFEICNLSNDILGFIRAADDAPEWNEMNALFMAVSRSVLGWGPIVEEIESALTGTGVIGEAESSRGSEAAGEPDPAEGILAIIAGKWLLRFTRKGQTQSEEAIIHPDGKYETGGKIKFILKNFRYDGPDKFSFDKSYPSEPGIHRLDPVYHREILQLTSPNNMLGHKDGDETHILDYSKIR